VSNAVGVAQMRLDCDTLVQPTLGLVDVVGTLVRLKTTLATLSPHFRRLLMCNPYRVGHKKGTLYWTPYLQG